MVEMAMVVDTVDTMVVASAVEKEILTPADVREEQVLVNSIILRRILSHKIIKSDLCIVYTQVFCYIGKTALNQIKLLEQGYSML